MKVLFIMLLSKTESKIWNGKLACWLSHLFLFLFLNQNQDIFSELEHIFIENDKAYYCSCWDDLESRFLTIL